MKAIFDYFLSDFWDISIEILINLFDQILNTAYILYKLELQRIWYGI